ncbi:MAG: hypothetical protein GX536_05300 [Actinobacteria bacterium]|nr:hypothetical protein [Actinomycetota bacterium]
MHGARSRGESSDLKARVEHEDSSVTHEEGVALPRLSSDETVVLDALSGHLTGATLGWLRSRCGLPEERLQLCLAALRHKGLVVRLNTVVESYSCRFPGVRVS